MCFTILQTGIAQVYDNLQNREWSELLVLNVDLGYAHSQAIFDEPALNLSQRKHQKKSYWLTGAITGFAVGSVTTYIVLHSGGSTSLCNQSANQDAIGVPGCIGLSLAGGIPIGGLGALIGSFFKVKDSTKVSFARIPNPDQLSSNTGYGLYFSQAF